MSHLPFAVLEDRLLSLPPAPNDEGQVALVVVRPQPEARLTPNRVTLTRAGGVAGDRWAQNPHSKPANQITLMRADVARLIADGQPLSLFGDNLLVELDLSQENLPAGTRLRIGAALCEVTPQPHTGCGKFAARFGQEAREFANAPAFADWRLRGLHVCVLEDGEVSPGDPIHVLSRPLALPFEDGAASNQRVAPI